MSEEDLDERRLFFGASVVAPWPRELPNARLIHEENRHITLGFLGNASFSRIQALLSTFPKPPFRISPCGKCDQVLFLPKKMPRVVSYHVQWLELEELWLDFISCIHSWLKKNGFLVDERKHLDHITIGRMPFDAHEWKETFSEIPIFLQGIHLFESIGNLTYPSLWNLSFIPPFEELEHTADIAFRIRAEDIMQLHLHAQMALAYKFPPLLSFFSKKYQDSLENIIIDLNELIAKADIEHGCPFKAVSFHGHLQKDESNVIQWEMIVDV